jgi:phage shock protein E
LSALPANQIEHIKEEPRVEKPSIMIQLLKNILGLGPEADYKMIVKEGAIILDVRSKAEFAAGHIRGAINIPLGELSSQLKRLPNKEKSIITCCASGMRSSSARSVLESHGYKRVINGGGWRILETKIK